MTDKPICISQTKMLEELEIDLAFVERKLKAYTFYNPCNTVQLMWEKLREALLVEIEKVLLSEIKIKTQ